MIVLVVFEGSFTNQNYSNYSGEYIIKGQHFDPNKAEAGIYLTLYINEYGQVKGMISAELEQKIDCIEFKGILISNKFVYNYDEDGWGNYGTINLEFKNGIVLSRITQADYSRIKKV